MKTPSSRFPTAVAQGIAVFALLCLALFLMICPKPAAFASVLPVAPQASGALLANDLLVDPSVADLQISKTLLAVEPITPGDVITFSVRVTNTGPTDATGVLVTDTLPTEFTFGSCMASDGTCGLVSSPLPNEVMVWDVEPGDVLPYGGSRTVTIIGTVDLGYCGPITNTATTASDLFDDDPSNSTATLISQVDTCDVADLQISKTLIGVEPIEPGDLITYSVRVTNTGPTDATGVLVTDTLPLEVSFDSCTPSDGTCDLVSTTLPNDVMVWDVEPGDVLPVGGSRTVWIVGTVDLGHCGPITNTAVVGSYLIDDDLTDNVASLTTQIDPCAVADLQISKTLFGAEEPVAPGDVITYSVRVTNTGPSDAVGVLVTDTLPLEFAFDSCSPSGGGTCGLVASSLPNDVLVWEVAPGDVLSYGESATVRIVGTVDLDYCGPITNTAMTSSDLLDDDPTNSASTLITQIDPCAVADLEISKTLFGVEEPVAPGDVITYTVRVTNTGTYEAAGVLVTDTLPLEFAFDSCSPSGGGTCDLVASSLPNDVLVWEVAPDDVLSYGESATVRIVGTVDPNYCGPMSNTAVTSSDRVDDDPTNSVATLITQVSPCPVADLEISKTLLGLEPVAPGEVITYSVRVTNTGPADVSGVLVTDTLPLEFTFDSCSPSDGTCGLVASSLPNEVMVWHVEAGGILPYGGSRTVRIVGTVDADYCGPLTNSATTSGDLPDDDAGNSTATLVTDVSPCPVPELEVSKELLWPSVGPAAVGQEMRFLISIENTGVLTVDPLLLRDEYSSWCLSSTQAQVPPDVHGGSAGFLQWNNLGSLAPGQTTSLWVDFTAAHACDPATNTARVQADGLWYEGESSLRILESTARAAGYVFHDDNADGLLGLRCQGSDVNPPGCEPGLEGALAGFDSILYTTNTSGWYSFNLLDPGTHQVTSSPPAGGWWTPTTPETCDVTIGTAFEQVLCNFGYWWGLDGPLTSGAAAQQQAVLAPVGDTTISSWIPGTHGDEQNLWVRQPGKSSTLVQFDLSSLPQGAQIASAELRLFASAASNTTNRLYMTAYPVTRSWSENEATWGLASVGQPWEADGATGGSDHSDPVGWAWTNSLGWVDFELDPSAVAGWHSDPSGNHGLLLRGEGSPNRQVAYWFLSREHTSPAVQPQLVIGYELP